MKTEAILKIKNPLSLIDQWLEEAGQESFATHPNAACLCTSSQKNSNESPPSSRIVLIKEVNDSALIFYTNYKSQKALELSQNPLAALNFYWDPLARQINASGRVRPTSREKSLTYWKQRSRESQISQFVSQQSTPLKSLEAFDDLCKKAEKEFEGRPIPCPDHWGGFELTPHRIEFWLGRLHRRHQRVVFTHQGDDSCWKTELLFP